MKKVLGFVLICIFFFSLTPLVNADSYLVLNENKSFREKPGGALIKKVEDGVLLSGTRVDVISKDTPNGYGCKNNWYKVKYNDIEGYICSSNQVVIETADVDINGSFEQQMLNMGFTNSYLPYLKSLHQKHPNWIFKAIPINMDFDYVLKNESYGEISLVGGSDENLRSKEFPYYQNGQYKEIEPGFYVASKDTVAYYLDPRNFLTEEYIFMFQDTKYNASLQTRDAVKTTVSGTFLNTDEYIDILMKTAKKYNVNPVYLASRIRQEKGTTNSISTTGGEFTFKVDNNCLNILNINDKNSWEALNSCGSGKTYSGIYNYFNIGAYPSYYSPQIRGLIWANGGYDASVKSYLRPWKSKETAIMGGTEYLVKKFIDVNQNTLYYQKFNVAPDSGHPHFTNQYMTNVKAPASEGYSTYKSYKNNNYLNNTYEFLIPVYSNMPNDNQSITPDNNHENLVTPPSVNINAGVISSGFKNNNEIIYNIPYNTGIDGINSRLSSTNANLKVVKYLDKFGNNASGALGTGDTLVISNGKETREYKVVIYGDNNGDGKINIVDLLRVQKNILNSLNLSKYEQEASDTNKDGKVDIIDLLRVQKQILGNNVIRQE